MEIYVDFAVQMYQLRIYVIIFSGGSLNLSKRSAEYLFCLLNRYL